MSRWSTRSATCSCKSPKTAVIPRIEEWKKDLLRRDLDIPPFAESLVAFCDGMMVRLAIGTNGEVRKIFSAFIDSVEKGILR